MSTEKAPLPEAVREQALPRALRRIAQGTRLSSLDVPLLEDAADAIERLEAAAQHERVRLAELTAALEAIQTSTRDDEQQQQWVIRKYLDDRGIFNDNLSGSKRLVAEACKVALAQRDDQ